MEMILMKKNALMILGFCVVAGCTTLTPQEQRAADERVCQSYGFKAGDGFANCLLQLELDRNADRRNWQNQNNSFNNRPIIIYRND